MSRRTILSLVASIIMGIGFVGTFSDDASAYYRRGVGAYRGGVYRGGVYRGVRPGVAVGVGLGAVPPGGGGGGGLGGGGWRCGCRWRLLWSTLLRPRRARLRILSVPTVL